MLREDRRLRELCIFHSFFSVIMELLWNNEAYSLKLVKYILKTMKKILKKSHLWTSYLQDKNCLMGFNNVSIFSLLELKDFLNRHSGGPVVKNLPTNSRETRDAVWIPGSGRSPGGRHGNALQYSCLENFMARGAWWATVHRVTELGTTEATQHSTHQLQHHCFYWTCWVGLE